MVDRVALIGAAVKRASLSAVQITNLNKQLDKVLVTVLAELPLEQARALSGQERGELESTLRENLTFADLKKVAKKWEPTRKLDATATDTEVVHALVGLLHSRRKPYVPITISLGEARALGDSEKALLRDTIDRLAPAADLKKLATRWGNPALRSAARAKIASSLLALLDGQR